MTEPELYRSSYQGPNEEPFEAMQLANEDPMVAEKDFEEHNRAIGAWIFDNDGEIRTAGRKYLIVKTADGEATAGPGDWIVKERSGFAVYLKDRFAKKFDRLIVV